MVIARLLTEATVLVLVIVGNIYWCLGQRLQLPWYIYPLCLLVTVLLLLFGLSYVYIVYEVRLTDKEIETVSMAKNEKGNLANLKSIKLKRNYFYKYYALEIDDKQISFSTWFYDLDKLVTSLKKYLPKSELTDNLDKDITYTCDKLLYTLLIMQILGTTIFIIVFLIFTFWNISKEVNVIHGSLSDEIILGVFTCAMTLFFLYRNYFILLSPYKVFISGKKINLKSLVKNTTINFNDIIDLKPSPAWLDEGYLLTTKKGKYFISTSFNDLDELEELILKKTNFKIK